MKTYEQLIEEKKKLEAQKHELYDIVKVAEKKLYEEKGSFSWELSDEVIKNKKKIASLERKIKSLCKQIYGTPRTKHDLYIDADTRDYTSLRKGLDMVGGVTL